MAEWSCSGLQLRVRRFDSDSSLHLPFRYLQFPRPTISPHMGGVRAVFGGMVSAPHAPAWRRHARVVEQVDTRDLKQFEPRRGNPAGGTRQSRRTPWARPEPTPSQARVPAGRCREQTAGTYRSRARCCSSRARVKACSRPRTPVRRRRRKPKWYENPSTARSCRFDPGLGHQQRKGRGSRRAASRVSGAGPAARATRACA